MIRYIVLLAIVLSTTLPLHAQEIKFIEVEFPPDNGLAWLAAQQEDNGSWQVEKMVATRKATSLSLLAFLAAGHTHKEGKYKLTLHKGVEFLVGSTKEDLKRGRSGETDGYALAAIALCESFSMTQDEQLAVPAQQAIDIVVRAQNEDGGWGSQSDGASTTLDIGWPVIALMSGRLAGLDIPDKTFEAATRFLDQVQVDGGAYYGLTKPEKRSDTTSIGLLCRLHLGAKHDDPAIKTGLKYLVATGPSKTDLCYNYFSTLALFGSDFAENARWKHNLKEQVLKTQVKVGNIDSGKGSWPATGNGYGRIEATAMNLMCLVAYYRHLPLPLK